MKKALSRIKQVATVVGVVVSVLSFLATAVTVIAMSIRLSDLPDKVDELEKQVQAIRIEHGERLARIEGALFGVAPVSSDSAAAPVEPVEDGALASVPSASKIRGGVKK